MDGYWAWGKVRELCEVFISRRDRSSRVSTDWEKILSRFFGFGRAVAPLGRTVCIVCGNTGDWGAVAGLGAGTLFFIGTSIA